MPLARVGGAPKFAPQVIFDLGAVSVTQGWAATPWTLRGDSGTNQDLRFSTRGQSRRVCRAARLSATLAVSTFGGAPLALAQQVNASGTSEQESVVVEVAIAPSFCGEFAPVLDEVALRSPRIRMRDGETADNRVSVEGGVSGFEATVVLTERSGRTLRRELRARTCEELIRAVGFVIAVTYDPPAPEIDAEPEREPVPEPPPKVAPVKPRPTVPFATQPETDISPPSPSESSRAAGGWRVGVGGAAVWGVAPEQMWGGAAFVAVNWGDDVGPLGLVRLAAQADLGQQRDFTGGSAEFRRWTGELFLAPEWDLGRFGLAPGVSGRAGLLQARGSSTVDQQSYDRIWVEVGAGLLGRLELFSGWHLEAEGRVSKPLTRYAFQFDPVVFHRVSSWLGHVGIFASKAF